MANKKDKIKFKKPNRNKNRVVRPQREKPSSGGSLRWLWRLFLTAAIVVVLFWQQEAITSWLDDIGQGTIGLFGWGLALIILAVLAIFAFIWRQQLAELSRRWKLHLWNLWLGTAAFIFVVWGILAFFDAGGQFGQDIIGEDQAGGILRLVGLAVLGVILVAPRLVWRLVKGFFAWIAKPLKAPPPRPIREEYRPAHRPGMARPPLKATPSKEMTPPPVLVPPEIPRPGLKPEPAVAKSSDTKPEADLKQVAQEVWQKYGQSPSLTVIDGWSLPPIDILDHAQEVEFGEADNIKRAQLIEEALASYGVEARVVQINAGPTVTQFGIEPGWDRKVKEVKEKDKEGRINVSQKEVSRTRVKVERITSLANDLALALASPSIRIEAPVPGKSIVGVEVPNTTSGVVSLRGVIETNGFQKILVRSSLALALGKGAGGEAIAGDLDKMPHLLIAGATGSGKTVCLNAIICCLLLDNTPNDVKLIMIDPKRVELTPYNSLPHLASPVIVDVQKALPALRWLNQEMDRRYQTLATVGARNIAAFNKGKHGEDKMPYTVLIIDELADLMMAGFDEVEHILCRLAQLARAVGIHLIVATQRPSVDVVTGLIKANFPTRISFAVTSQVDSRTILDIGGAEKLLGRGDMLYAPTEAAKPKRLQGCYVSDAEVERLVYFWNNQKREEALAPRIDELKPQPQAGTIGGYPEDSLLETARQLAREHSNISTSFLQRRLHIGYPRAARIMDQLNEEMAEGEE
jgi:S-DNA-T family DNA segregation ATPase FtsK/SpoIIIE